MVLIYDDFKVSTKYYRCRLCVPTFSWLCPWCFCCASSSKTYKDRVCNV